MGLFDEIKKESSEKFELISELETIEKSSSSISEVFQTATHIKGLLDNGDLQIAKTLLFKRIYEFGSISKMRETLLKLNKNHVVLSNEFTIIVSAINNHIASNIIEIVKSEKQINPARSFDTINEYIDWVDEKVYSLCNEVNNKLREIALMNEKQQKVIEENRKQAEKRRIQKQIDDSQLQKNKVYLMYFINALLVIGTQYATFYIADKLDWYTDSARESMALLILVTSVYGILASFIVGLLSSFLLGERHDRYLKLCLIYYGIIVIYLVIKFISYLIN
jgi:hypothetical protein